MIAGVWAYLKTLALANRQEAQAWISYPFDSKARLAHLKELTARIAELKTNSLNESIANERVLRRLMRTHLQFEKTLGKTKHASSDNVLSDIEKQQQEHRRLAVSIMRRLKNERRRTTALRLDLEHLAALAFEYGEMQGARARKAIRKISKLKDQDAAIEAIITALETEAPPNQLRSKLSKQMNANHLQLISEADRHSEAAKSIYADFENRVAQIEQIAARPHESKPVTGIRRIFMEGAEIVGVCLQQSINVYKEARVSFERISNKIYDKDPSIDRAYNRLVASLTSAQSAAKDAENVGDEVKAIQNLISEASQDLLVESLIMHRQRCFIMNDRILECEILTAKLFGAKTLIAILPPLGSSRLFKFIEFARLIGRIACLAPELNKEPESDLEVAAILREFEDDLTLQVQSLCDEIIIATIRSAQNNEIGVKPQRAKNKLEKAIRELEMKSTSKQLMPETWIELKDSVNTQLIQDALQKRIIACTCLQKQFATSIEALTLLKLAIERSNS